RHRSAGPQVTLGGGPVAPAPAQECEAAERADQQKPRRWKRNGSDFDAIDGKRGREQIEIVRIDPSISKPEGEGAAGHGLIEDLAGRQDQIPTVAREASQCHTVRLRIRAAISRPIDAPVLTEIEDS